MTPTAAISTPADAVSARSFGAALVGFLGSTVATTLVLFLLSQG